MDPLKTAPAPETKLHFLDYWRIIRIRKTVILAVFLLVVITAVLVTFIMPETYASTARVKVERDQTDIAGVMMQHQGYLGHDPYFILTEFEVMQSEAVLSRVHTNLPALSKEWGKKYNNGKDLTKQETLMILKGSMNLKPVRNTSLIEITFYDESPDQAALIANAIAAAYKQHRLDQRSEMSRNGIRTLREQLASQDAAVSNAQKKVDVLREQLKINDILASESAPTPLLTADYLRRIKELQTQSRFEYNRLNTTLEKLRGLSLEELTQAIPMATSDTTLISLIEQRNLVEQQLVVVERDYGPEHNMVKKTKSQLDDVREKIKEQVGGILFGLSTKVEGLKKALDETDAEVEQARAQDREEAQKSRPYWDAKRHLDELMGFRRLLDAKIKAEEIDMALPKTSMVEIVDPANPDPNPVKPNKPVNIALGIIIGLVVGIGLAFFIEYLDTSVKTIDDIERALQTPVLGVIPQNVGLIIDDTIESPHAEAYRVLRTNLLFSRKDDKLNSVAVVSAGAGEGKSTTVFNLATVFAQNGQRVVIVDSDLRRPTLHKMMKVTNSLGLTNYLLKQNSLDEVIQTSRIPTLDFMASGKLPSSSLGILSSTQMRDLINELKKRYDFVFFDSPPIMGVSDASILASAVDMTIQVIQYRRYPQPMNIRAKNMIEKVGGNLLGIVLNNINMSQDESYYYYSGYYNDYYYSSRGDEPETTAPAKKSGKKTEAKEKLEINQKY